MNAARRIEDYALIGDCHTAALVGKDGAIDWLCFPRFDSPACFAALLGGPEHGRFRVAPRAPSPAVTRRYRDDTLVLETRFETGEGAVTVTDFMPVRNDLADLVRVVRGERGAVPMGLEFSPRFDYGSAAPWLSRVEGGVVALAGPDALRLIAGVPLEAGDDDVTASFTVREGQEVAMHLTWGPSHVSMPPPPDPKRALEATERFWRNWVRAGSFRGPDRDAVVRSMITLKALTYAPTGAIVAAPSTSLPEHFGGVRNWDYRYCWLRDATFTLLALLDAGYVDEARAFREWLLRSTAGKPSQVHIMYGVTGERRLDERELPWLPGFAGSSPVRVGNGAYGQFQLDVFGEVMDVFHQCWKRNLDPGPAGWRLERVMMDFVERAWQRPDEGIWEVRGPRRHFTHSKVMAWVAADRAVRAVEEHGLEGPLDRWRALRARIHAEVCERGYDADRGAFVQSYGSKHLDASALTIPLVGFLPATDPRVRSTVEAIERELTRDGFVARYVTDPAVDGLPEGEAAFLLCSFWMVDCLWLLGRRADARALFERLLSVRNDVGLLSESYDVGDRRLAGNFPQAFSHVGLVNAARLFEPERGAGPDARAR
ncbi:MAG TPA: glycoside hydrolase family 15 protein [Polyangiaceae bacterium]|nr:glycoside hydrolase family 15 protein [Polyangiaceae bacterium]